MMRIKNGPGHKIYEVGRTLEGELKQNKNNPAYSEKQRQLVTNYISTLQQLSHAYYSNQEQTRIKQIEQETLKTYQELTDWAVSNASSKEESGIVPLAGLGEGVYLASSTQGVPSSSTSTWYTFPDLSEAQEASPSPLVQNSSSSTSDALNNISTNNVTPSLTHVKSALHQASRNPDITFSLTDSTHNPLEQTPYNTYNERRKGNADGRQSHQSLNTSDNHAEGYRQPDSQLSDTTGVSQADGSGRGRRAGRNVGSDRGLSDLDGRASDRLSQDLALTEEGVQPGTLEQSKAILQNVRANHPDGVCVDLPSASEGAIRFVISDGHGGATVTVKADGDICALGKEPSCQIKGVAHKLLITAIRHGGLKMDCYGIDLVNIYAKYGFKPVARVAYNAEYADEDMKAYVRDVRNGVAPDVYVLMHDGSTLREAKARGARLFEQAYRRHTKIPTSKGGDAVRERSEWRDFVWSTAC